MYNNINQPTNEIVTKEYVDSVALGIDWNWYMLIRDRNAKISKILKKMKS